VLGSILGTARSAIQAQQIAIQTTSQNIANAETAGYTRQRTELVPARPTVSTIGSVGTGVVVRDTIRARDAWLDASWRQGAGDAAGSTARRDLLDRIEQVLGEPSETGIASALDAFWSSWSDLANAPTSQPARTAVRQRGQQVAGLLRDAAGQLGALDGETRTRLRDAVGEMNGLAAQVADLNRQIVAAEVSGRTAPDLRDQRDRLVDEMARIAPVRTIDRADGSQAVLLASMTIVDGVHTRELAMKTGATVGVGLASDAAPHPGVGGALGAMAEVINADLPTLRGELDALAARLVADVNALHAQGPSGIPFFDPAGATAATIGLSAPVAASAGAIEASYAADPSTPPRANGLALDLAALRDGGIGIAYRDIVTRLASTVSEAGSAATVHETIASRAEVRRASMHGVSVDEEMVALIRHQQAYTAAARVVNVVDEMAQAILDMV
jgi:flagellar hook-associated protein 1 FlgK